LQAGTLRGIGYLRRIEEFSAILFFDGLQQNSMGDAGDKVADILLASKRRHGSAIGFPGTARSQDRMLSPIQLRPEDRLPDLTTPGDGGIGQGGIGKFGGT
jgi:hypothetical protein